MRLFLVFSLLGLSLSKVCNVIDYGAVPDGKTTNTKFLQMAIDDCKSQGRDGITEQNTLLFPADSGVFLTGSVELASFMDVVIEKGASIRGTDNPDDYPLMPPLPSYGSDRDIGASMRYRALLFGTNLTSVNIRGTMTGSELTTSYPPGVEPGIPDEELEKYGAVDGNGGWWWRQHFRRNLEYGRPHLVELMFSSHIVVQDILFTQSAFWTFHPYGCTDVRVHHMTIKNPGWSPNTDGIDIDSTQKVHIEDCRFSVGDDGIVIKSGLNEEGRAFGVPSADIVIKHVKVDPMFDNLSTNGIAIGSEMSGDVRNVFISDVDIHSCEAGVYVKSMMGRGGVVENIEFTDITASKTLQAIRIDMDYSYRRRLAQAGGRPDDEDDQTQIPTFRNIIISNLHASGVAQAGTLSGMESSLVQNLTLKNVTITGLGDVVPIKGFKWKCSNVMGTATGVSPPLPEGCLSLPSQ